MENDHRLPPPVSDRPFGTQATVPSTTIIIVAWRLDAGLSRCLEALATTVGPSSEVIVVGNGIDPGSCVSVLEEAGLTGRTIVLADNHGPSPARNAGASRAAGQLLLFLDDDSVPEPAWVTAHQIAHEEPGVQGVRGRLVADNSPFLTRLARAYDLGDAPRRAVLNTEGNMSVKAESFRTVGGFAPIFGHEGVELTARLIEKHGAESIRYTPDAVVRHDYVDSFSDYLAKRFRHGRMMRRLDMKQVRMAAGIRRTRSPWDMLVAPLRLVGASVELAGVLWPTRSRAALGIRTDE